MKRRFYLRQFQDFRYNSEHPLKPGDCDTCSLCGDYFVANSEVQGYVNNGIRQIGPLCQWCYDYFVSADGIKDSFLMARAVEEDPYITLNEETSVSS